jgi:RimJ/RimL family protein N-acetyltransferase
MAALPLPGGERPPGDERRRGEVRLRDVCEADLGVFYGHQLDPLATAMAAFPTRLRDAFFAHWRRILADPGALTQTVLVDGHAAGHVLSWEHDGVREVGYWLGREHWGRGVATEALRLFLRTIPQRPLHAHVAAHNIASRRVLEKCGFRVIDGGVALLDETGTRVAPEDRAAVRDEVEELVLRLE